MRSLNNTLFLTTLSLLLLIFDTKPCVGGITDTGNNLSQKEFEEDRLVLLRSSNENRHVKSDGLLSHESEGSGEALQQQLTQQPGPEMQRHKRQTTNNKSASSSSSEEIEQIVEGSGEEATVDGNPMLKRVNTHIKDK